VPKHDRKGDRQLAMMTMNIRAAHTC
jgi:hypothetical protein